MYETLEQTAVRRALAKANRESYEVIEQLSDEQQGYKDSGMKESDFD